jgi:ABC-type phosphate transport system permease subunit
VTTLTAIIAGLLVFGLLAHRGTLQVRRRLRSALHNRLALAAAALAVAVLVVPELAVAASVPLLAIYGLYWMLRTR